MPGLEDAFNHGILSLGRRPFLRDPPISQLIPDAERMTPCRALHRGRIAVRRRTLVPFIAIDHLAFHGEVDLAIVDRSGGRFELTNETIVPIELGVKLIAKVRFGAFLRLRAVLAPSRLRLFAPRRIRLRVPRISSDKGRILDGALFHREAARIELSLEFFPDRPVSASLHQPLLEIPDTPKIGDGFGSPRNFLNERRSAT